MTSLPASAATDRPARPRTVEWALYAIVARCVFVLVTALLEYPYHQQLLDRTRQLNPKATAAQIQAAVPTGTQGLIQTLIGVALILVVAKFVRDGKNWARILFAVLVVLLFRDVFGLTALAAKGYPVPLRVTVTLTGAAAIVAVSLLWVRPSAPFFRRTGGAAAASPFAAMFRPRSVPPQGVPPRAAAGRVAATAGADRSAKAGRPAGKSRVTAGQAGQATATADIPGVARDSAVPRASQSGRPRGKSRKADER
jgi:hypothetical protein